MKRSELKWCLGAIYAVTFLGLMCAACPTYATSPLYLSAQAGSDDVVLIWPVTSGATSYSIYRGGSYGGESLTAIATGTSSSWCLNGSTCTYPDTGVTNGGSYYYYVVGGSTTYPQTYANPQSAPSGSTPGEPLGSCTVTPIIPGDSADSPVAGYTGDNIGSTVFGFPADTVSGVSGVPLIETGVCNFEFAGAGTGTASGTIDIPAGTTLLTQANLVNGYADADGDFEGAMYSPFSAIVEGYTGSVANWFGGSSTYLTSTGMYNGGLTFWTLGSLDPGGYGIDNNSDACDDKCVSSVTSTDGTNKFYQSIGMEWDQPQNTYPPYASNTNVQSSWIIDCGIYLIGAAHWTTNGSNYTANGDICQMATGFFDPAHTGP